jgi:DNA-binding HxlR family transcriptional regulator
MTATMSHPLHQDCQKVSQILARIGEKWSMLVVMLLRDGPRRFNDIKRNTAGISQQMLTRTLRGLERDGIMTRTILPTSPPQVEYSLTELGHSMSEPEIVPRVIEHIDRRLPHVAGALGSGQEIRGRCIDRPVAVPEPQWVQDVARIEVILDGELRHLVGGIVPPRRQQPVAVLIVLYALAVKVWQGRTSGEKSDVWYRHQIPPSDACRL